MAEDDIRFTSEVEVVRPEKRRLPFSELGASVEPKPDPRNAEPDEGLFIFVSESTLEEIRDYSGTKLDREVGGVLMGGYFADDEARGGKGQEFIVIDGYIPVREGQSNHASFEFSLDAWTYVTKQRNERWPDDRRADGFRSIMVGWHHTHPTFGIFLSSMDQGIQAEHFNLPWQVALVVDPVRKTLGFLRIREKESRPIRCPFFLIRDKKPGRRRS